MRADQARVSDEDDARADHRERTTSPLKVLTLFSKLEPNADASGPADCPSDEGHDPPRAPPTRSCRRAGRGAADAKPVGG